MPIRKDLYEKMIEERLAQEEEAERENRRMWIITLLICLFWSLVGAAVTLLGFVITDDELGPVLVGAGWKLALALNLLTLVIARAKREKKGYE